MSVLNVSGTDSGQNQWNACDENYDDYNINNSDCKYDNNNYISKYDIKYNNNVIIIRKTTSFFVT